jgi:hypothetical protein
LETLEERCLLSGSPDLVLVAATAVDARTVAYTYQVRNADVGQSFHVGVYRSADAKFDSGSIGLGTDPIPAAGGVQGIYQRTFAVTGGLPIDPSHPYVLVVGDPEDAIPDPDRSNNVAAFRKYVIGIVVHGLSTSGTLPTWVNPMAASLQADGYDAVIPLDWAAPSLSQDPNVTAQVGANLAARVASLAGAVAGPVDMHFISHSRGSVVVSQAVQDLDAMGVAQLNEGYLQLTFLDPHPAHPAFPAQYSASSGVLGRLAAGTVDNFQAAANDPPVVIPPNVADAEVYYQHTEASQTPSGEEQLINLWGEVPIRGYCTMAT